MTQKVNNITTMKLIQTFTTLYKTKFIIPFNFFTISTWKNKTFSSGYVQNFLYKPNNVQKQKGVIPVQLCWWDKSDWRQHQRLEGVQGYQYLQQKLQTLDEKTCGVAWMTKNKNHSYYYWRILKRKRECADLAWNGEWKLLCFGSGIV